MRILESVPEKLNFEPTYSYDSIKHDRKSFIMACVLVFILIASVRILQQLIIYSEKQKNMILVEQIIPDNGKIITQQVEYATSKKLNPDDTSAIFFEVVNSGNDEKYPPGTLIKYAHRHMELTQIEGKSYVVIDKSVIHFYIKPEHVKKDIIKRR